MQYVASYIIVLASSCSSIAGNTQNWCLAMDEVGGSLMTLSTDSEKQPLIINDSESVHHHSSILIAPAKFNNCCHQLPLISVIFILVASVPALLVGCTVGFPSAALLDLQDLETRPQYKFDTVLSDVFAVNAICHHYNFH